MKQHNKNLVKQQQEMRLLVIPLFFEKQTLEEGQCVFILDELVLFFLYLAFFACAFSSVLILKWMIWFLVTLLAGVGTTDIF